jgi:hypothetical protein
VQVEVRLSPTRLRRGQTATLTVTAASDDQVTAVVRYHRGRPTTYQGKVSSSGTYVKSWKVPKTAPLGQASLGVTVKSDANPYSGTVTFEVTK